MIIGIWLVTIVCLAVCIGEIRYRYLKNCKKNQKKTIFDKEWEESIDIDVPNLSMEQSNGEFVSSVSLSRRGSWRVAQNQVMGLETFEKLRSIEYSKML